MIECADAEIFVRVENGVQLHNAFIDRHIWSDWPVRNSGVYRLLFRPQVEPTFQFQPGELASYRDPWLSNPGSYWAHPRLPTRKMDGR